MGKVPVKKAATRAALYASKPQQLSPKASLNSEWRIHKHRTRVLQHFEQRSNKTELIVVTDFLAIKASSAYYFT